jgi:hypothetical protein
MTMRNRKNVIVAFVLVAVMLMAVGYAALSTDLFIGGNATINADKAQTEFDSQIKFDAVKAGDIATNGTGSSTDTITKTSDKAMDIGVNSLALKNETATFTFRVLNYSDHNCTASIETLKIMGIALSEVGGVYTDSWIEAKVEWVDAKLEAATDSTTPGVATFKITFKLLQNPTEQVVRSINITIDATTID